MNPGASIEIGTNSIRMLIAEKNVSFNTLRPILRKRAITRLGKNFNKKKARIIEPEPMLESISVLRDFLSIIRQFDIPFPIVVATGIVRDARNQKDFLDLVNKKLGHSVKVITGKEESDLTRRGVLALLDDNGKPVLIFDCGGGSTEFIWTNKKDEKSISIKLGAVILTDDYLITNPPKDEEIHQITNKIDSIFKGKLKYIKELCKETFSLVGTGGTAISVAAMIYGIRETEFDEKINGLIIKRKDIELLFTKMKGFSVKERIGFRGLEPGREDIILAGIIMIKKIMDYFGKDEIIISYSDLLEGLLL